MKNSANSYIEVAKKIMRKHYLLFIALKVVKILVVVAMVSCSSSTESGASNKPDTVKVDTIQGNAPEDSIIYKNNSEDEEEMEGEDGSENSIVPEES
jgi:hypothetical protein